MSDLLKLVTLTFCGVILVQVVCIFSFFVSFLLIAWAVSGL